MRAGARLLAALLALAVAPLAPAAEPVRLEVWDFPRIPDPEDPHDRYSWLRRLLAEFEAEHAGVEVRLTELTWKSGNEKVQIALYAGTPPDLISGTLDPRLARAGAYEPPGGALRPEDRRDYLPGVLDSYRVEGRVMGWPWAQKGDYLFLNEEAFEAAGAPLPRGGRWTSEGWEAAVRALRAARERDPTAPHPLGMALVPGKTAELGLLLPRDGDPIRGGALGFTGPPARAALERLRGWQAAGVLPPSAAGWSAKDLWVAFTQDRAVAMAPFGLWALKALETRAPFRFTVAAMPPLGPGAGGAPRRPAVHVGYFVLRRPGRDPRATRMAHELARFLTSGENQGVLRAYGQFPTRRSAGDLYAGAPLMSRAADLLVGARALPLHPAREALDEVLKRGVQRGLAEPGVPADEVLAALERDAARVLAPRARGRPIPLWARGLAGLVLLVLAAGLFRVGAGLAGEGAGTFLLAGPGVLLLALFMLMPAVEGLGLAFLDVRPTPGGEDGWMGLGNFRRMLSDPAFLQGCRNTLLYAGVVVPGNLCAGLLLAVAIHPLSRRMRSAFRGAFYLPGVASVVALALVWRQILDERGGLLNRLFAPDTGAGWLLRALLPCLERVPTALAAVAAVWVVATVVARPGGGGREPGRRRVRRDGAVVLALGLALLWVLAGARTPPAEAGPIGWLTTADLSFWSVLLMVLVRGPGGMLLVYLAALEAVSMELHEAAEVDGAGAWLRFYHVTLPALAPTTLFLAITGMIDSFQAFGQVFLLTDGGPAYSSTVVVHRMYLAAFRDLDFGLAAAQGMVLFAAVVSLGGLQLWARRE